MDIDNELSRPVSNNSVMFPMGITMSSPDPFPIDFERDSFEFSYGH